MYYRGIKCVTLIYVVFNRYAELLFLKFSVARKVFKNFKFSLDLRYVKENKYFFDDLKNPTFLYQRKSKQKTHGK